MDALTRLATARTASIHVAASALLIVFIAVTTVSAGLAQQQNGPTVKEIAKADAGKTLFGAFIPRPTKPPEKCNCKCGERNDASRIVGGQPAGSNEFPWMARLSYFSKFYCGGMLINDRYVLTAAHCVRGFMWFMIKVTFGEHDRCDNDLKPESRFVLRAISQDFSYSSFDNDIALLRLNDRVPISETIRPICLPTNKAIYIRDPMIEEHRYKYSGLEEYFHFYIYEWPAMIDELYVDRMAIATGWGTLKEDGKPACILQEVELPVISNKKCRQSKYNASMITDNMLCAGYAEGGRDSCQGDSGGPLVTEKEDKTYKLIGVVSWGNGCARPGYPGVYTRVNRYLDWIAENTKEGCYCTD